MLDHIPHPHLLRRKQLMEQHEQRRNPGNFNSWLAVKITNVVGTMWCAYLFAILALISLPDAIHSGVSALIAWIAQTFLQLVLLSIIIVGQNILSAAADRRSEATYKDADAVLHEANEIQKHLEAQDRAIEQILAMVERAGGSGPRPAAGSPPA